MATVFRDIRDKINENYDKAITVDDLARYTMELCEALDKAFRSLQPVLEDFIAMGRTQGKVNEQSVKTFEAIQKTIADLHGLIEKLARKEGK